MKSKRHNNLGGLTLCKEDRTSQTLPQPYSTFMQSNLEALEEKVLQLPEDQRITLAHKIIQSTEPPQDLAIGQWWETELVRRIDLLDSD